MSSLHRNKCDFDRISKSNLQRLMPYASTVDDYSVLKILNFLLVQHDNDTQSTITITIANIECWFFSVY